MHREAQSLEIKQNINSNLKSLNSALQVSWSFWVEASLSPATTQAKRDLGGDFTILAKISKFQDSTILSLR